MTKTSSIARPLLALAAVFAAAPLAAEEATVVTGERQPVYQERVSYADLDLRQGSARQALKVRVFHAADRLCTQAEGTMPFSGIGLGSSQSCTDLTYQDTKPQINAAIARARAGQQLAAMAVVVSAPRVR